MLKCCPLVVLGFILCQVSFATTSDSLNRQNRLLLLTPRFNTLNMAPVSGNIVNRNVNMDATLLYVKNQFTLTVVGGADLQDRHSEMNYLLTNVRYKFKLTKNFSVTPFLAFYSEHAHQLFDKGSDANGGMFFSYQRGFFTVELFALVLRLTHENALKDAINRLEIKWKFPLITFSGFVYHNSRYFDDKERLSLGFKALLPEFKLFNKVPARTDVTGSFKIYENAKSTVLSGVFLSVAFPFNL
jgi:hypothetical protein